MVSTEWDEVGKQVTKDFNLWWSDFYSSSYDIAALVYFGSLSGISGITGTRHSDKNKYVWY